ncbi:Uncharacterized protein QTN25_001646 [Entamoeba marina]
MLAIFFVLLLFSTYVLGDVYEEEDDLTPFEKVKNAQLWAYNISLSNEEWINENPDRPFIIGGIFESTYSLYNNLQMLVITSNLPYDTYYINEDHAPKLKITIENGTETQELYYKYHRNSADEPLSDYSWEEYFYPLPDYLKSYSFINGNNETRTNYFVMFISYPLGDRSLSKPLFGTTIKTIQLIGPYVDSNEWEITGNVFADLSFDECSTFVGDSCQIDYTEAFNQWDNILDVTGWTFGKDLSLLITFSFDGFFCTPFTDFLFFNYTSSISSKWEYCDYFIEDELWETDPCCNKALSSSCNTFRERKTVHIDENTACSWDFTEMEEKNITNEEKYVIASRAHGMQDLTQIIHDFHFTTLPTIFWHDMQERSQKKLQCEYILNDPDSYYEQFGKCPFEFNGIEGFEIQEGHNCRILTADESKPFLDICSVYLGDDGELQTFSDAEIQAFMSLIQTKTASISVEDSTQNICYSYDGVAFIAEDGNENCVGYVCDSQNDKRVFMNLEDALSYCPELATNCSIQSSGCAVDSDTDVDSYNTSTLESFHAYISVYDLEENQCDQVYGQYLDGINTETTDSYECLSQVTGCLDYDSVLFSSCDEAMIYGSFFHWNKRNLPLAEKYGLAKRNDSDEVSYNAPVNGYETVVSTYLDAQLIEEVKNNAQVFFAFLNDEVGPFVRECLLVGKYEYNLFENDTQTLTIQTKNRIRSSTYETVTMSAGNEEGTDFTYYLFDSGYLTGSHVFMGIVEKQFTVNHVNSVMVSGAWDTRYCEAYDNLDVRLPLFFYDDIAGVDYDFIVAYIVGDGIQFEDIDNSDNVDLYVGISEYSTLNFDESDVFEYPDFVKMNKNTSKTGDYVNYTAFEFMYLDCLITSSDDNALAFDLDNSYVMCRIPADIVNTLTDEYIIYPIYRLPKSDIHKTYPDEAKTTQIALISSTSGAALVLIICSIVLAVYLFYKYRKIRGRNILRLYDDDDLSSLGGPLVQYS